MGLIVNGKWVDNWYDTNATKGEFKRQESRFRDVISKNKNAKFPAVEGRYHLYVSLACPWAHRTLIFRKLKQLESIISVSVVKPEMLEFGWQFDKDSTDYRDDLYDSDFMYQLYLKAAPDYQGRVTVPVLWDKQTGTIVNNESSDIIRIFNSAFNELTGNDLDFYPEALQSDINIINDRVYNTVNNGVYRAGFATTQTAYEQAFDELFTSLDWLESHLSRNRYLLGERLTEADWRLFTTLIRFDAVYFGHFKCNLQRLSDYHHLSNYVRELYQMHDVSETVDLGYTKQHYYGSHKTINPTLIVPKGPQLDFSQPHEREKLSRSL